MAVQNSETEQLAQLPGEAIILSRQRRGLIEVCRNCPQRIYIELRIPPDVQSVDQIIFTLSSHDQGMCYWDCVNMNFNG